MPETCPDLPEFGTYRNQSICDNTLDDAQLATRCPLDNARSSHKSRPPPRYSASHLDRLPTEVVMMIFLCTDSPSLTGFRRVNRRAMELVDLVPQYAAIIKHYPDVIRAIASIQADAFDCDALYRTLSTTRCATCARFGDHLYLISCRRVCYFCFTQREEYCPLAIVGALRFLKAKRKQTQRSEPITCQQLQALNPPRPFLACPGGTASLGQVKRAPGCPNASGSLIDVH